MMTKNYSYTSYPNQEDPNSKRKKINELYKKLSKMKTYAKKETVQ